MQPLQVFTLGAHGDLEPTLLAALGAERGHCEVRHFPDGESYVRLKSECRDRRVAILCTLHRPNERFLPLVFLANTLRELGATSVGLIAPYLAYMRQDKRFHDGEAVTSRLFATQLSAAFDWLVTVDPHLHRYASLDAIYAIPNRVVHAAPLIARWIRDHIDKPLLIGPDSESAQWVSAVATAAGAPFQVLEKIRRGDRDVSVSLPDVANAADATPVLVDDIIASGHTMLETIAHLRAAGLAAPVCIGVHGLFAENADTRLLAAGAARVITTDSIDHPTNAIGLANALAAAIAEVEQRILDREDSQ